MPPNSISIIALDDRWQIGFFHAGVCIEFAEYFYADGGVGAINWAQIAVFLKTGRLPA